MILVVVSTGHFDPLISECGKLHSKYEFYGQIGSSTVIPPFPYVRTATPDEIQRKMEEAEIVVSHGGAGMTAMLCRLQKKCIIIPKQKRYGEMNNLQVELAQKWGELGMGEYILDVEHLDATIQKVRRTHYRFPTFPKIGLEVKRIIGLENNSVQVATPISGY